MTPQIASSRLWRQSEALGRPGGALEQLWDGLGSIWDSLAGFLDIKNIEVVYDNVILALHNVSLEVPKGKVVA